MSSERSRLIKNAIEENTRYLTGDSTYKTYDYMIEQGIIKKNKIVYKADDEESEKKIDYKNTIIDNFDNNTEKMVDFFEEYEYNKSYKYSVVKEINISNDALTKKLSDLAKKSIISLKTDNYIRYFKNPTLQKFDDVFCLKFSYTIGPKSNCFAYPVIATIYPNKKLLIISFDSIPYNFKDRKDIYQHIVISVRTWVEKNLSIGTKEIKLLQMVKDIINIKNADKKSFIDINEYVRDGYDKRGGRFKMIADDNDEMSFLDQLSKIAESLSTKEDREKLNKFIHEISNNMMFVERGLTWKSYNGRKSKMTMTIRDNFINDEMSLIHFYDNNWERKRVIYGIEYIIDYKSKVKK